MAYTKEKIVIIGFGWVGQANALALQKLKYQVFVYDPAVPERHYPQYSEAYDTLKYLKSPLEEDGSSTWYIVCVGDRVSDDGKQDISLIEKATHGLKKAQGKVVLRSSVLPESLDTLTFDIYLPEFLHEKYAVEESINPYFFVMGVHKNIELPSFLKLWERKAHRVFKGTPQEASYVKYLSNLWHALRVAFVNEFGDGIEKPENKAAVERIEHIVNFVFDGESYLKYGKAFKGHCLPKDMRAFTHSHAAVGKNVTLLEAVYRSNQMHEEIEKMYELPEWYSFWGQNKRSGFTIGRMWQSFNGYPIVQKIRKRLRFIVDGISKLIPDRTIKDTQKIWEGKAKENARHFSYREALSGRDIIDSELSETGRRDYQRYVLSDTFLLKELKNLSKKRALDLGCGVGRITEAIAEQFGDVSGVDFAPSMIKTAKTRLADKKNIAFEVNEGETLPYDDNYFDFIFSYQTLQYLPTEGSLCRLLKEVNRVLRSGGVAKVQFGTGRGVKKWQWAHGVTLPLEAAQVCAERAGFTVLDHHVESMDNLWLLLQK